MANEVEYGEAVAISDNRFPGDQERLGWQGRDCRNNDREATREVIAVARDELLAGPSRRAMMRKPSCLISCSQPGPDGGRSAGDGKQGSIMPSPGRVRSRNDMGA